MSFSSLADFAVSVFSVFHQFAGSFSQSLSFQTKLLGCD
jgi:hypothetical protein